jgi:hypothetical protein
VRGAGKVACLKTEEDLYRVNEAIELVSERSILERACPEEAE